MLYDVLHGSSILLGFAGLYFVIRVWLKWRNIDMEVLKARVFLDKKFLERNWMYVFLSGASISGHQTIALLSSFFGIEMDGLLLFSEVLEYFSLLFIVILAHEWFNILYKINKN